MRRQVQRSSAQTAHIDTQLTIRNQQVNHTTHVDYAFSNIVSRPFHQQVDATSNTNKHTRAREEIRVNTPL